jgi:hypothetical protein
VTQSYANKVIFCPFKEMDLFILPWRIVTKTLVVHWSSILNLTRGEAVYGTFIIETKRLFSLKFVLTDIHVHSSQSFDPWQLVSIKPGQYMIIKCHQSLTNSCAVTTTDEIAISWQETASGTSLLRDSNQAYI